MAKEKNKYVYLNDNGTYVFIYDDDSSSELFQQIGRHAMDPDLSFSCYDAATVSQGIRKLNKRKEFRKRLESR